jgi:hypothetical protein
MADNTLPTAVSIPDFLTTYTITENVGSTDEIDYYKFELGENGILGLQLSDLTGNASVTLIRDFNGNEGIDSDDTIRSLSLRSNFSESRQAEEGVYYIGVGRGLSVGGNYTLRLDFTPVPSNTDSNPGNNLSTALNLGSFTGTKILKDYTGSTDAADYYKFTLDENSSFGWQIQDLESSTTISLIRDVNKNGGIDSGDTLNSFSERVGRVSNRELEAGEYFIGIEQSTLSTGDSNYTLQLDITPVPDNTDSNPGNDLNTALNVGSISGQKILKDFVGTTDTLDYYKFTLDQNGAFGWQIQDLDGTLGVTLIKDIDKDNGIDTGEELQSFFDNETGVFNRQLEAGEYIFEVERSSLSDTNNNYTLQLDFTPIPATTPSNPGNDLNNALDLGVLSSQQALTDFVGFTDGVDVYKFTLDRAITLSWQASNLVDSLSFDLIQDIDGDLGIDNNEFLGSIFTSSSETAENDLAAGEYFIRVTESTVSDRNSNYTLILTPPKSQPPATDSGALDADGNGKVTFAQDGLLLSAFTFFNTANRTDFSVLDRFIVASDATRKTGNAIAEFLKNNLTSLDADGNGKVTFAQDGLLLAAFTFFNTANRTDFSVLDRFIVASDATRKTGNAVADFLKGSLTSSSSLTAPIFDRSPVDDDALFFDLYFDITGTDGNDTLIGGDEKNSIVGGAGNDIITTGGGKNILKFGENSGSDVITDFQTDNDLIQIESSLGFADANAILAAVTYDGLTAELVLSEGNTLTIEVDRPLTNDNFLVV